MNWGTAILFGFGVLAFALPPPILARLFARVHARERIEDLARQDDVDARLAEIHTLVNSNLSAALQGELDQTKRTLVLLRRIEKMTPGKPTVEERAVLEQTRIRVAELETILADRKEAGG